MVPGSASTTSGDKVIIPETTAPDHGWPPCGSADCGKPAHFADPVGVGWCHDHEEEAVGAEPVESIEDFDAWWMAVSLSEAAGDGRFKGLDYGVWP